MSKRDRKCSTLTFSRVTSRGSCSFPCKSSTQWSSLNGSPRQYFNAGTHRLIFSATSAMCSPTTLYAPLVKVAFKVSSHLVAKSCNTYTSVANRNQSCSEMTRSSSLYSFNIFQDLFVDFISSDRGSNVTKRGGGIPKDTQASLI